ncbi:hypothetical protein AX289_31690 [Methylorubrum populi]|nr:hypothetical protein AX289_31690 [Methylorubrum populi]
MSTASNLRLARALDGFVRRQDRSAAEMLLKIGDAERHDVLRVEQVALSKAHDTFLMATELHVSICYCFDRIRRSFDSKTIENAI